MLMIPVPACAALILGYLSLRSVLAGEKPLMATLLAACALQSLAVALVAGYGVETLQPILPITASAVPPLAWITYRGGMFGSVRFTQWAPHVAAPVFAGFCRLFAPVILDVVVPLIFVGYGAAILLSLRRAHDLPLARLESGGRPQLLWRCLGWLLIFSALSDVVIGIAYFTGNQGWAGAIISLFATLMLFFIGFLGSLRETAGEAEPVAEQTPASQNSANEKELTEDGAIIKRLDALLEEENIYLDASLTLRQIARRLTLPEKRLSSAVNRVSGENVSRYINNWRIEHACRLMKQGGSVTSSMLDSGFNTKSNFNREFLRVKKSSPSEWAKAQRA